MNTPSKGSDSRKNGANVLGVVPYRRDGLVEGITRSKGDTSPCTNGSMGTDAGVVRFGAVGYPDVAPLLVGRSVSSSG